MRTRDVASNVSTEIESMIRSCRFEKERSETRLPSPLSGYVSEDGVHGNIPRTADRLRERIAHKARRECHDVLS